MKYSMIIFIALSSFVAIPISGMEIVKPIIKEAKKVTKETMVSFVYGLNDIDHYNRLPEDLKNVINLHNNPNNPKRTYYIKDNFPFSCKALFLKNKQNNANRSEGNILLFIDTKKVATLNLDTMTYSIVKKHKRSIDNACFSENGQMLAISHNNDITIFDPTTMKKITKKKVFKLAKKHYYKSSTIDKFCYIDKALTFKINNDYKEVLYSGISRDSTFCLPCRYTIKDDKENINGLCSGTKKNQSIFVTNNNIILYDQSWKNETTKELFWSDSHYIQVKNSCFAKVSTASCNKKQKLLALGYQTGKVEVYLIYESDKLNPIELISILFFNGPIDNICFNKQGDCLAIKSNNDRLSIVSQGNYDDEKHLFNAIMVLWLTVKNQEETLKKIDSFIHGLFMDVSCTEKNNTIINIIFNDIERLFFLKKNALRMAWESYSHAMQMVIQENILRILELHRRSKNYKGK